MQGRFSDMQFLVDIVPNTDIFNLGEILPPIRILSFALSAAIREDETLLKFLRLYPPGQKPTSSVR